MRILSMDTDRMLFFGVLALRTGLIGRDQFVEACTLWAARMDASLADLLVERGSIQPGDVARIDDLVERELPRDGGDAQAGLTTAAPGASGAATTLGDADLQWSLSALPVASGPSALEPTGAPSVAPGRYRRIRLFATGGIGHIWLVHDNALGRQIALKELRPEQADDALLRMRFLREAQITGQLEHPGIVPVYELARWPGDQRPYYTMRLIRGRTLTESARAFHDRRAAGTVDWFAFLSLLNAFVGACNTVAYAHSRGVLHRDLKGQNVVLGDYGEVEVLDWGLAKLVGRPEAESVEVAVAPCPEAAGDSDLTLHGHVLGTPAYMSPEQAAGRLEQIDVRTDVYGLGAILYEILAGRPPFSGADTRAILRMVLEDDPPPARQRWADVPPALEEICLKALAKRPADRFGSPGELAQAVQHWQEVQRQEAEDALQASEALYHSLVETIPMNVYRKDIEGRFTFGNKGFCETTKWPPAELIGRTDFDLFPAELAEKYRRDDARVLSTGETLEAIEEHVTAGGRKLYVQVIKTPVHDGQGQIVGTQGIFWDVSDRKHLEEALERMAAELAVARERLREVEANGPDGSEVEPGPPI
jgi:PAS domain S-box-containing protein